MAKKQKWKKGDVFLIPLLDSTFAVGQIVHVALNLDTPACVFFDLKKHVSEEAVTSEELGKAKLISFQFVTRKLLSTGVWKIIGNFPAVDFHSLLDIEDIEARKYVGIHIIGSLNVNSLMNAYYALRPWDFIGSDYFDNLLISPDIKPKNLIYKLGSQDSKFDACLRHRDVQSGEARSNLLSAPRNNMAKKQKWDKGDVFLVPLLDSTYAVGQIVHVAADLKTPVCVLFDLKKRAEESITNEELKAANLILIKLVTRDHIIANEWKIVSNLPPVNYHSFLNIQDLEAKRYIGVRIIGSGIINKFINAYYALLPWDLYPETDYFDTLLVSPDLKPKNLIYK